MAPIFGKQSTMPNVAALSRSAANALVDREEHRTGSRMLAYQIVAQTVGTSSEWLRKFISEKEGKEPRITVGFNLLELYHRVCDRVEQAGDNEKLLKGEINAALESFDLLVDAKNGTHPSATASAKITQAK